MSLQSNSIIDDIIHQLVKNEQSPMFESNTTISYDILFRSYLIPGYYVIFEKDSIKYYGIILSNKVIVYFDYTGKLQGYLKDFKYNEPYKMLEICKPQNDNFTLKYIDELEVVWKYPKEKVTKSISEIEKELGLEPGTLIIK